MHCIFRFGNIIDKSKRGSSLQKLSGILEINNDHERELKVLVPELNSCFPTAVSNDKTLVYNFKPYNPALVSPLLSQRGNVCSAALFNKSPIPSPLYINQELLLRKNNFLSDTTTTNDFNLITTATNINKNKNEHFTSAGALKSGSSVNNCYVNNIYYEQNYNEQFIEKNKQENLQKQYSHASKSNRKQVKSSKNNISEKPLCVDNKFKIKTVHQLKGKCSLVLNEPRCRSLRSYSMKCKQENSVTKAKENALEITDLKSTRKRKPTRSPVKKQKKQQKAVTVNSKTNKDIGRANALALLDSSTNMRANAPASLGSSANIRAERLSSSNTVKQSKQYLQSSGECFMTKRKSQTTSNYTTNNNGNKLIRKYDRICKVR